jgi:hypothetical protein
LVVQLFFVFASFSCWLRVGNNELARFKERLGRSGVPVSAQEPGIHLLDELRGRCCKTYYFWARKKVRDGFNVFFNFLIKLGDFHSMYDIRKYGSWDRIPQCW